MASNQTSKYDTIIIGSGAGGLTAGICLARAGKKVLMLEQHYVPGGWCHSFHLNGQKFSPGVHYIGMMGEGDSTRVLYEGLGLADDLVFFKMVDKGFEHARIGDVRFDYPSEAEAFKSDLIRRFPQEKKGIEKFLAVVWKTQHQLTRLARARSGKKKLGALLKSGTLVRFGLKSLQSVIDKYINDEDLKAVLSIQCGDHGLVPNRANFAYHCGVMGHYSKGGYFPMGGGSALVKAKTNAFKKHGGEIRTQESVERILVTNNKVRGVRLESGEIILAEQVVSNADPHATYDRMLDKSILSKKLQKKLEQTTYSVSSVMAFVTLEMDVRSKGIDSGNYWISSHNGVNEIMQYDSLDEVLAGDQFDGLFISCSTLKDPSSQDQRYYNFELITFMDYQLFEQLKGVKSTDKRYLEFKEQVSRKFLNSLEDLLPGAKDAVVQMEIGTPNTNKFYINATKGNVYGIEKTIKQIGPGAFSAKSEIEELYLCGSSTLSHGVAGAANSGLMTAAEILHCEPEDLLEESGSSILVFDAEDDSEWPEWLKDKMAIRAKRVKTIEPAPLLRHKDPVHHKEKKESINDIHASKPERTVRA